MIIWTELIYINEWYASAEKTIRWAKIWTVIVIQQENKYRNTWYQSAFFMISGFIDFPVLLVLPSAL